MLNAAGVGDHEHGSLGKFLALWDMSKHPYTNDREAKLGYGFHQKAAAYYSFDEETQIAGLADGLGEDTRNAVEVQGVVRVSPPLYSSLRSLNPDHWVPRFTDEGGLEPTGTWDVRLTVDATNPQDSRTNLGMMVIDQEEYQLWGWLSDSIRVTERTASVADAELRFTTAGFLDVLYPQEKQGLGLDYRGCIALSVHENLGAVTDGGKIGSLSRILAWPGASGGAGGGVGGTGAAGGGSSGAGGTGGAGGGGGGRPSTEEELCLNAHAPRRYPDGKMLCWPIIDKAQETEKEQGKYYAVKFYEGQKGSEQVFMARDGNSNFGAFPTSGHPQLAAYVQVPAGAG